MPSISTASLLILWGVLTVLTALTDGFGLVGSADAATYEVGLATSGNVEVDVSVTGNGTAVASDNLVVTSTCPLGYTITIGGPSDNNLYLGGDSSNTSTNTKITASTGTKENPVTITGANRGTWGYSLTSSTGTGTFIGLTSTATTLITKTSASGDGTSTTDTIPVYYGVSALPTQAPGTYKLANAQKINYAITAPIRCTANTVTLNLTNASSIIIDGTTYTTSGSTVSLSYGTHTISGTFPQGYEFDGWSTTGDITIADASANATTINVTGDGGLTLSGKQSRLYMQNMTASDCTDTAKTVYDKRDEFAYRVQKLADGKCWMLDNLAIDLTATSYDTLYGTGTNAGKTTNATSQALGYLKGKTTGTASDQWAMAAVKKNWTSSYSYSQPWIAVDSSTSGKCNNAYCVNSDLTWSSTSVTPKTINGTTSIAQGQIGVYYNYCAASAGSYCWGGSGTSDSGSPTADPNTSSPRDITSDICPYGWRLPTGSSSGEFQALYKAYGSNSTNFQKALSTPISGAFGSGTAGGQGLYGHFWSSTLEPSASTNMYLLGVYSTFVYPSTYNIRGTGYSIRCVFGS